jgi:hypothetical protein
LSPTSVTSSAAGSGRGREGQPDEASSGAYRNRRDLFFTFDARDGARPRVQIGHRPSPCPPPACRGRRRRRRRRSALTAPRDRTSVRDGRRASRTHSPLSSLDVDPLVWKELEIRIARVPYELGGVTYGTHIRIRQPAGSAVLQLEVDVPVTSCYCPGPNRGPTRAGRYVQAASTLGAAPASRTAPSGATSRSASCRPSFPCGRTPCPAAVSSGIAWGASSSSPPASPGFSSEAPLPPAPPPRRRPPAADSRCGRIPPIGPRLRPRRGEPSRYP